MDCCPELVTGLVDGALSWRLRAGVLAHLTRPCPDCQVQAAEERALRRRLRSLEDPEPLPGFEARMRRRFEQVVRSTRRLALAAAFGLFAALLMPLSLLHGLH